MLNVDFSRPRSDLRSDLEINLLQVIKFDWYRELKDSLFPRTKKLFLGSKRLFNIFVLD